MMTMPANDNPFNTLSKEPVAPDFNSMINDMVEKYTERAIDENLASKRSDIERSIDNYVSRSLDEKTLAKATEEISRRIMKDFGFEPRPLAVSSSYGTHLVNTSMVHEKYKTILDIIGNNMPAYLYGPTGSGKSLLAKQVADGLGLPFHVMNSVTDEYKLTGFIDAAGRYHGSEFREAFENGGVFLLDEIDASAPDVLVVINAAISNSWFPFPDRTVTAHKNFRVIATGNTTGRGADSAYRGRVQLDAASLDRFVMVKVDYDNRIDKMMVGNDNDLYEFVLAYRQAVEATGIVNAICSHRRVHQLAILSSCQDPMSALQACLLTGLDADDIRAITKSTMSIISPDANKWVRALNAFSQSVQ